MVEREGPAAWDKIVAQHDKDSLREFMAAKGFSEGAIEAYGVLNFVEAELNSAVVEELREDIGKAYVDMQEIVGGMDRLPNAFYARAPGRDPLRRRGHGDRPGSALGHDPLPDEVRTVLGHRRLRDLLDPVLGPADGRNDQALLASRSSGRSASCTTRRRPRSCSRCAGVAGRKRTGSTAARP